MKQKIKVLVAMSGGVDSSVAALLMKRAGFQVIGTFMKNWSDTKNDLGECTWKADRAMAMKIASKLEIPLITLDFEKEYRGQVVDKMFKLYKKGITPNPDVDCNQKIKFPLLRKAAKKLGAEFVVTGHYARIKKVHSSSSSRVGERLRGRDELISSNSRAESGVGRGTVQSVQTEYQLLRAKDESKDQSYFLYRLSQEDLKHSLFPMGDYTKIEVRKIARKNNFPNSDRKGTVGICFIGKVNLKKFLQARVPPKKGKILNPEGKQIGTHDGIYYYTIGQRIGPRFGIEIEKDSDNKKQLRRWYVARKNLRKNEIIAAPEGNELLYRKEITIKKPHWIIPDKVKSIVNKKYRVSVVNSKSKSANVVSLISGRADGASSKNAIKVNARIRQVGELLPAKLYFEKGKFKVTLNKTITGVSEGQAIVLYKGAVCLGGGVISF
ncbi:MAG: tRNA-specific 2-thiouridylase [Nanoarchaeota archaeon]|nr:tRNA-specific 2-thiouridylase [Nanoarchaeota archaeon]MBU2459447.1 tRNA-specific 2-thiouridylase [Nanoarchaeota archaeon]